ncbi:MAG: hypothetical protein ACM3WP_05175 [Acidobacteriota bacterium]
MSTFLTYPSFAQPKAAAEGVTLRVINIPQMLYAFRTHQPVKDRHGVFLAAARAHLDGSLRFDTPYSLLLALA